LHRAEFRVEAIYLKMFLIFKLENSGITRQKCGTSDLKDKFGGKTEKIWFIKIENINAGI